MKQMGAHGMSENDKYEPFAPTADGVEATTHAWIAIEDGQFNHDVSILHGTNRDEGSMFCPTLPKNALGRICMYWAVGYQRKSRTA